MEPTLRNGDALLMKDMDHNKLRTGDIVALQHPSKGPIAHRIVSIKPISQHDLLIQTRGDANQLSEWWLVTANEKVAVAIVHIRFFGHALEFIKTVPGMILLLASVLVLLVVLTKLLQSSQLDSGG